VRPGELYVVDFGPPDRGAEQAGVRPAIVVHREAFLRIPHLALVCPLTTVRRDVPNHVPVPAGIAGLTRDSYVMTEQLRAVDRRFVGPRLGQASPEIIDRVLHVLVNRALARPAA
jgi:mRNA interferase MazF